MTRAPIFNSFNALDGGKAPTGFFAAMSEADEFCAEVDTVRELQTRIQELEAENAELRREVARLKRRGGGW